MTIAILAAACRRLFRALTFLGLAAAALPAQAGSYLANKPGELKPEARVKPPAAQPAQLLVTFQRDGTAVPKVLKIVRPKVERELKASGMFTTLSDTPVPNGAIVSVTINNITEKGAAGKGFKTGLTFGLAGTMVTDRYKVTVDYVPAAGKPTVTRVVDHAIFTTIGLKSTPPADATKMQNLLDAFDGVVRQTVAHALNGIAADPALAGAERAPEAAPAPAAAK